MSAEYQNELSELAGDEIDAVAGGVEWGPNFRIRPTGFGVKTDERLAQEQLLEANFRG